MESLTCNKCGHTGPPDDFKRDRRQPNGRQKKCRKCNQAGREAWRQNNLDREQAADRRYADRHRLTIRERNRQRAANLRLQALQVYGGRCECCGESAIEFLGIDHINGGGNQHRNEIGGSIYRWLKKANYPKEGFRILCHNCNLARGFYGYCPHEAENQRRPMSDGRHIVVNFMKSRRRAVIH